MISMLNPSLMLAQEGTSDAAPMQILRDMTGRLDILNHPAQLLDGLSQVPLVLGGVFVVVGALSLLFG